MNLNKIVERAEMLEATMSHGAAISIACHEVGISGVDSIVSTAMTNRAIKHMGQPLRVTEFKALKLRRNDKIEGDSVVLAFKKGAVKMLKNEWAKIVATNYEPHAIAARKLSTAS